MRMVKRFAESGRRFGDETPRPGRKGAKRSVNVSIDSEVLAAAKAQRINLSQALEDELRKRTEEARARAWRDENRAALESHNRYIAENGIWSEKYRGWGKTK